MSVSFFFYEGYELTITLDEPGYKGECEKLKYYTRDSDMGSLITQFKSFIDNRKEKQLSEKQLKEIKSNINFFLKETREIDSRFHNYLLSQDFIFKAKGEYEERSFCAVHNNFLKEWEADKWGDSIPDWAEIKVTYEVYKLNSTSNSRMGGNEEDLKED